MDENFTKFNSSILNKIEGFINSQSGLPKVDILYMAGFQGCGKSEIVNKAMEKLDEDTLLFRHLCFENSVIDDFLLGFYDTLRYYSISKKINLKKGLSDNFAQKVSFYFKNLEKKSLIVIDNFDVISTNSEIMDFLAHLGKYENVKLILISRFLNTEFFEEKGLNFEVIEIPVNDYFTFKLKTEDALKVFDDNDIDEFYNATKGYELYLKMALRYIITVNSTLKEFMEDYKKRNLEFEDFLISKVVSLVPPVYVPFLQNMACLNHSVKIAFIEHYGLGDVSLINYLNRKMLISKFDDEIYLKDYLKQYFLSNLSIGERVDNYKNLIKIYENELSKSPKERLLRLSRESIRKQIEFVKTKIPSINSPQSFAGSTFSYLKQSQNTPMPWFSKLEQLRKNGFQGIHKETEQNEPAEPLLGEEILSEEERALVEKFRKDKKEAAKKQVIQGLQAKVNKEILAEAENFEQNFDFTSAIQVLKAYLETVSDKKQDGNLKEIYIKLAKNYIKINDFENALKNYDFAKEICKTYSDITGTIDIKLLEADLYKKLYRLEKAKNTLNEAVNLSKENDKTGAAKGCLALGEIYEMENNFKEALEHYKTALNFAKKEGGDRVLLSEIYYRTAVLYDDGQNPEKALEYYKKSVENSDIEGSSGFLSASYANMGMIYNEIWNETGDEQSRENATENLILALDTDLKNNNQTGVYTICKQLAAIFKGIDAEKALEYLNLALNAAQKVNDNFKLALSHLEIGDYYYNSRKNASALRHYLEARKALGESISEENKERITVRINDMKIKMETPEFEGILKEYE